MSGFVTWIADSGVVQGVIIGLTFAYLTTVLVLNAVAKGQTETVNGWSAIRDAGHPGSGLLVRAALQKSLPVVNVFEEAAYWTATKDEAGERLSGAQTYGLHFAVDELPPNDAFWSLTATDHTGYIAANQAGPSSVGSNAGLVKNADGSVDITLQSTRPVGAAPNWLATPSGGFKLMLRAYLPGPSVKDGEYKVPPVVEVSK
ncbi:MAG: DUF1214 domain-containing protein [Lacisediminihabitans sp.]